MNLAGMWPLTLIYYLHECHHKGIQTRTSWIHSHKQEFTAGCNDFLDDLVLSAASEDDLQHCLYNFKLVAEKYSMEISTKKTKIMVFCGKEPVPSKIC
jgi:hypothetical protein